MAYMDNIAPKRENPIQGRVDVVPAPSDNSSQERSQPQSSKFRTVSTAPNPRQNPGNQVKVQSNIKGTGIVGRPAALAEVIKDVRDPAKANPSGGRNKTTARYAKGK